MTQLVTNSLNLVRRRACFTVHRRRGGVIEFVMKQNTAHLEETIIVRPLSSQLVPVQTGNCCVRLGESLNDERQHNMSP